MSIAHAENLDISITSRLILIYNIIQLSFWKNAFFAYSFNRNFKSNLISFFFVGGGGGNGGGGGGGEGKILSFYRNYTINKYLNSLIGEGGKKEGKPPTIIYVGAPAPSPPQVGLSFLIYSKNYSSGSLIIMEI